MIARLILILTALLMCFLWAFAQTRDEAIVYATGCFLSIAGYMLSFYIWGWAE